MWRSRELNKRKTLVVSFSGPGGTVGNQYQPLQPEPATCNL